MADFALSTQDQERLTLRNLPSAGNEDMLAQDVRHGLTADPKYLPPKYFYDERGSWLFEKICATPEYYPTRIEDALLAEYSSEIIHRVRPDRIIELGSGSSRKTRHLLEACAQHARHCLYQPLDVCEEMLLDAGRRLIDDHAWLSVEALVGDYCAGLNDLPREQGGRLFVFLGGTIGNFYPREALSFLRELRGNMREDDWLLLGADRVKDLEVLNAAYNDAQGYTAEFNLNLLNVINRELSADFDLRAFSHRAYFNEDMSWIEMHLCSRRDQQVSIRDLDLQVSFARGETILTEISRKFTGQALAGTLRQAGFGLEQDFTPGNNYYSLVLARAAGS